MCMPPERRVDMLCIPDTDSAPVPRSLPTQGWTADTCIFFLSGSSSEPCSLRLLREGAPRGIGPGDLMAHVSLEFTAPNVVISGAVPMLLGRNEDATDKYAGKHVNVRTR